RKTAAEVALFSDDPTAAASAVSVALNALFSVLLRECQELRGLVEVAQRELHLGVDLRQVLERLFGAEQIDVDLEVNRRLDEREVGFERGLVEPHVLGDEVLAELLDERVVDLPPA